jgi:DUF2905 family protein
MTAPHDVGRALIVAGIVLIVVGAAVSLAGRVPWLGRLPGDIVIRRGGFTLYLPLGTCVLVSLALTFLFSLWRR